MNTFDNFSILFQGDSIYLGEKVCPLGQITTEFLDWPAELLDQLRERTEALSPVLEEMIERKDRSLIPAVQKKLDAVYDLLITLPPYRDIEMDTELTRNAFLYLLEMPEVWEETMTEETEGHGYLHTLLTQMRELPDRLQAFRNQVRLMADEYFESLPKRNSEAYGAAFARYYRSLSRLGPITLPETEYEQSFPAHIKFVPAILPGQRQPAIVEEAQFGELHAFLYADFYRGLMRGNAPRRCHNCGRFFLLTRGYNTCYCNNIAPGETERTCRQVGAHRVAARLWAGETPLQREYATTINRIKSQRQSGKISRADFTRYEDEAKSLVAMVDRGELTDEEAIRKLDQISRIRKRRRT